jgi:hypothetical protein
MKNVTELLGFSPELRAYLESIGGALPHIRGTWFVVDPYGATYTAAGGQPGNVYASVESAYAACTSGAGDGILVLSGGTTATHTTSRLEAPITWSKYAITVYGVAAGGYNSRARIASHSGLTSAVAVAMAATPQTITRGAGSFITDGWEVGMTGVFDTSGTNSNVSFTVSAVSALVLTGTVGTDSILDETSTSHTLCGYFPALITVSGENNRFYNLYFYNGASHVLNVGAVAVSANRNLFVGCHFNSGGTLQSAAAGQYDVRVSSSECRFVDCWFGNNNTLRSGAANGNINLGLSTTQIGQNFFEDCYILSTSATASHGALKVIDAATLGGWVQFKRCSFVNWASGAITALTTAIIGATPNNCGILLQDCAMIGWAAWGANNDKWATSNAAGAAGTGGIAASIS